MKLMRSDIAIVGTRSMSRPVYKTLTLLRQQMPLFLSSCISRVALLTNFLV